MPDKHRVVVQLTEADTDAFLTEHTAEQFGSQSGIAEIEIIDNSTIKCLRNDKSGDYHMHFDCVGFNGQARVVRELSKVIVNLLHEHSHSCIIHFNALRRNPMKFLAKMLVQELDRRLLPTFSTLNCITLEYYDLRKYDMVNMLTRPNLNPQSSTSLDRGRRLKFSKTFTSTVELYRWLRTDFTLLWANTQGHDCFDIRIVYVDSRGRLHRVKLMIYQVYISELDAESLVSLSEFLQNVGDARKHCTTVLTDCLREYFINQRQIPTLLFFEVPIMKGGAMILNDMLTLAQAAYIGTQSVMGDSDLDVLSTHLNFLPAPDIDPAVPTTKVNKKLPKPSYVETENLSMNDLNALSSWYNRIDENFSNVVKAMEHYYESVYQNKTAKIYSELKSIVNFSKSLHQISLEQDVQHSAAVDAAKLAMVRYRDAINDFRELVKAVERSNYNAMLWVYLKTKNYNLLRHVLKFKEKQLEYCQSSLVNVINQEIVALHNIKNN